jgi:hypothetical protein
MKKQREELLLNTAFYSVTRSHGALPRIVCGGSWLQDMGFVTGALVQAIPEPNGISFTLCDENIGKYSELSRSTEERNGRLIQVIQRNGNKTAEQQIAISGHYILSGGLTVGDCLMAQYSYGLIRMRKADGMVGTVGSYHDNRIDKNITILRLFGEWLSEFGFASDTLATAASEPGCITLTLYDKGIEQYSALVKYARENKLKLYQLRQHYKYEKSSGVDITGSCLERAGFVTGDPYKIICEYGQVKLKKLD